MHKPPDDFNAEADRIIAAIWAGEKGVIEGLYDLHREKFLQWAGRRFLALPSDLEEAWQEAIVIFYERVRSGRQKRLKCTVKTFLFAIGYKWLKKQEFKKRRFVFLDKMDGVIDYVEFEFFDPYEEEKLKMKTAMKKLSSKCQELLDKRHYRGFTIEELSEEYATSKNSMSAMLSQCLKKLLDILGENE